MCPGSATVHVSEGGPHTLRSESRTVRRIDARFIRRARQDPEQVTSFERTSLDSHADTSCAGSNTTVLALTGEKVNVFPFSDDLPAIQEVPIASVMTVWENPTNGEAWVLVIHEALYFGEKLAESLLCPNQLRAAGNIVNDAPIQFDASSTHSITIPGAVGITWSHLAFDDTASY